MVGSLGRAAVLEDLLLLWPLGTRRTGRLLLPFLFASEKNSSTNSDALPVFGDGSPVKTHTPYGLLTVATPP